MAGARALDAVNWREEAVDGPTIRAAERLAAAVGGDFYLAGGTALALRAGHRVSLDLDLFSATSGLDGARRTALARDLDLEVLEEKDGTLHGRLEGRAVSLFRYPYPLLKATDAWRGLRVASLEDIAAMKVSAIIGRGARKDFVDLRELCRLLGFPAVMAAARARYPSHKTLDMLAAKALVYFEDAESEPMPRLLRRVSWESLKAYFEEQAALLVRRGL